MKTAFDKIAAGLNDAIAYAEGDRARARIATSIDEDDPWLTDLAERDEVVENR